eukprot:XP_001698860.1 predicted protein [Chlamydomonas reinhardtii]
MSGSRTAAAAAAAAAAPGGDVTSGPASLPAADVPCVVPSSSWPAVIATAPGDSGGSNLPTLTTTGGVPPPPPPPPPPTPCKLAVGARCDGV